MKLLELEPVLQFASVELLDFVSYLWDVQFCPIHMLNSSNIKDAIKDIVKNYLGLSKLNIDLGNYSTEFTSTNVFED